MLTGQIDNIQDVNCFGGQNGGIQASATGGTAPYEYCIDGVPNNPINSGLFAPLPAGNYIITIKDSTTPFPEIIDIPATVSEPPPLTGNYTTNGDSVSVSGIGGTPPYTYSLDNGTAQVLGAFNNLSAGTHYVDIFDTNNCRARVEFLIFPNPSTGDVTGEVCLQDKLPCHNTFCFQNVAPCTRIKVCVDMDKDTYNQSITDNGSTGDFDTNFLSISIRVLDTLPPDGTNIPLGVDLPFSYNSDFTGGCVMFRIPESWANTTKYIVFIYRFQIAFMGASYIDHIYVPYTIQVADTNSNQISFEIRDDDGNLIEYKICSEYEGKLNVCVETSVTDKDFCLLPLIQKEGEAWQEYSTFDDPDFLPQTTDLICFSDNLLVSQKATFQIDPTKLSLNDCYCIKAVLVPTELPEPVDLCPCIEVSICLLYNENNGVQTELETNYLITGLPVGDILSVDVFDDTTLLGSSTGLAGFYPILTPYIVNPNLYTKTIRLVITTIDGCVYRPVAVLSVDEGDNDTDCRDFNVGAGCVTECELPCDGEFLICDYMVDIGPFISVDTLAGFQIRSFSINGTSLTGTPINAPTPLVLVGGYPMNLVTAFQALLAANLGTDADYFTVAPSTRLHPNGQPRYIQFKFPACWTFEIIIGGFPVYRLTENGADTSYDAVNYEGFHWDYRLASVAGNGNATAAGISTFCEPVNEC